AVSYPEVLAGWSSVAFLNSAHILHSEILMIAAEPTRRDIAMDEEQMIEMNAVVACHDRQRITPHAVLHRVINHRILSIRRLLTPDLGAAHHYRRQLDGLRPRFAFVRRQRGQRVLPQRYCRAVRTVKERERL